MRALAICSALAVLAAAAGAAYPAAHADHATAVVSMPPGSSIAGCQSDDTCFIPAAVSIDLGGEVTWTNDDSAAHTVTSGDINGGPDGRFDSGLFPAGGSFSVTFDGESYEPGTYEYYCLVHPWMDGTVTVVAAGEDVADIDRTGDIRGDDEPVAAGADRAGDIREGDEPMEGEGAIASSGPGGGCLVATAAHGTELAPQVQRLREARDGAVMGTASGAAFMGAFGQLYYSFSPAVADLEREHPAARAVAGAALAPLLAALSPLAGAEIGSEAEMVAYGMAVLALAAGAYGGAPAAALGLYRHRGRLLAA